MANKSLDTQIDLQPELEIELEPKIVSESINGLLECEEGSGKLFEYVDDAIKYLKD